MILKLTQRLKFWLVGFLGSLLVRALVCTVRVRILHDQPARRPGQGVVYCFWHAQLLSLSYLYRKRNIHVLVSSHRDGEYIVRVTSWLGFGAVRGSSTRGGVRALSQAIDKLRNGIDIAVTPDGPRGPRQQFKPGALFLARESGAPLVLGACVPERAWRLGSWDGFYIPKPFTRVAIVVHEHSIPHDATDDDLERKRAELEQALNDYTRQAEEAFAVKPQDRPAENV